MHTIFTKYSSVKEFLEKNSEFKDVESLVVVEANKDYDEGLIFQNLKQEEFTNKYKTFLSRYSMLSELFMLGHFCEKLEEDGYTVAFLESTSEILEKYERLSEPLEVEGLEIPNGGSLYPFQQFSLRKALELSTGPTPREREFFFGMGTGTGKSIISAAGAQELFNRGQIDLVIAFTLRKLKINLCRNFNTTTQLKAKVVDGAKSKRQKEYAEADFDILVTNYDKCYFDFSELRELVKGKRVLWVMDEVQKVLRGENSPTRARRHLDKLVKSSIATVWPMSASVVSQTPLRYYDVFSLHGSPRKNLLGTKYQFTNDYLKSRFEKTFYTKTGGRFTKTFLTWDKSKLQEIRHRVAPHVQSVRKTDPGIRETFKGMQTIVVPVQLSPEDTKLYEYVYSEAQKALKEDLSIAEYVRVMRYICNTPEALQYSESKVAKEVIEKFPKLITSKYSSKVEMLCDQVESIAESGDKVVIFTQYTNLTLFIIEKALRERNIKLVTHYGTGMTDKEAQKAQDDFKKNDDITVFLSSDAGAYGLNFQEARFVISYEPTYSYDTLMQRGDRINRADSYLDGLTSYVYVTDNSVEEKIWQVNNSRRRIAELTQGTVESLGTRTLADQVASTEDGSSLMDRFILLGESGFTANSLEE